MAVPAHVWLYDINGSLIQGGSEVIGREGSIEVQSFNHGLSIPYSPSTGRLTSARVHGHLSIEKEFDKATPYLYRAVANNDNLQKAVIKWYRINSAGTEEEFFHIILESVRVVDIHPTMINFKRAEGMLAIPTESI